MEIDRSRFEKKVVGMFSGQEYVLRRVSTAEYLRELGRLPVEPSETVLTKLNELAKETKDGKTISPEDEEKTKRFWLGKGLKSPKVWFGDESKCPDDSLCYADLADEAIWLVREIADFSCDMRGLREQNPFFFGDGAADFGFGGEAVPQAANGAAAGGDDTGGTTA